jgi:hypothetical protein
MKRQELSANRQVVQSAVLVRGRGGGTDPSAGPRDQPEGLHAFLHSQGSGQTMTWESSSAPVSSLGAPHGAP